MGILAVMSALMRGSGQLLTKQLHHEMRELLLVDLCGVGTGVGILRGEAASRSLPGCRCKLLLGFVGCVRYF